MYSQFTLDYEPAIRYHKNFRKKPKRRRTCTVFRLFIIVHISFFKYIRDRTPASAVLASPYDSLYFVFTGRHAVKPWFHASDLYEPAYGVGPYGCEDVASLHAELRRLHVSYLIVDPMLNDLDSGYGSSCVSGLLARYGPEWTLTYTSLDRQHRVYRSLVESPSIDGP